jgi:hypothetical protein
MASNATNIIPFPTHSGASGRFEATAARRIVTPQAGRALKCLDRTIEYVANEFLHDPVPPGLQNPRLVAIRLLMTLKSEVYAGCPKRNEAVWNRRWPMFVSS